MEKSTGTFNLHKLYWYKARSALNWSPVVRLGVFGIDFQTQLLLAHKLFLHVTLVSGGSERWPWGGFWRFLWSEQPVQWNRKHHHQCLYKGLLIWKTGGREGWGETMNLIYLFFFNVQRLSLDFKVFQLWCMRWFLPLRPNMHIWKEESMCSASIGHPCVNIWSTSSTNSNTCRRNTWWTVY